MSDLKNGGGGRKYYEFAHHIRVIHMIFVFDKHFIIFLAFVFFVFFWLFSFFFFFFCFCLFFFFFFFSVL